MIDKNAQPEIPGHTLPMMEQFSMLRAFKTEGQGNGKL